MISLPSGRIAGITSIRARYHALRLNQRVTPQTPRQALYGLVDILEQPASSHRLPGGPGYRFSGITLDKLPCLTSWPADDRLAFEAWLRQENQLREIESARRRVVPDELPRVAREFDCPDRLHSALRRRLERLELRRASPLQWRQTVMNLRRSGIRDEELAWSGLLAFFDEALRLGTPTITREALLAQIDFSAIRLSLSNELAQDLGCRLDFIEVKHSRSLNRIGAVKRIAGEDELSVLRYVDTLHYYKVGYLKRRQGGQGACQWFVLDTIGNLVSATPEERYFPTPEAAFRAAGEHALQHVGVPTDYTPCHRYEHKTLCGGDDYREWLLTLPDYPLSYYNKHYYARNLLLHFRTKERVDPAGRRLLFIEEIQSDWHQSGARQGYQNRWPGKIPPAPFAREWIALALKLILLHAARQGYAGIGWTRGQIHESHYLQTLAPVRRLYDREIPRVLSRLLRGMEGTALETTRILTREPRLHISRQLDKWLVTDPQGSFCTKPRRSQREAMQIMARHCRRIELEVPMLSLDDSARERILKEGFPLFGESSD